MTTPYFWQEINLERKKKLSGKIEETAQYIKPFNQFVPNFTCLYLLSLIVRFIDIFRRYLEKKSKGKWLLGKWLLVIAFYFWANTYLFKLNNWNTRKISEICSKLAINVLEFFIVNLFHTFLKCFNCYFKQANVSWVYL